MNQDWNRAVLKQRAKGVLKTSYWRAFAVCLILSLLAGQISLNLPSNPFAGVSTTEVPPELDTNFWAELSQELSRIGPMLVVVLLVIVFFGILLNFAYTAFVTNPLTIGQSRFFYYNSKNPAKISSMWSTFTDGCYIRTVGKMAVRSLITFALELPALIAVLVPIGWGLANADRLVLLFRYLMDTSYSINTSELFNLSAEIGGVVLILALLMLVSLIATVIVSLMLMPLPYIIAENPNLPLKRVFALSRAMTRGQKGRIFVLILSFAGWAALAVLTFGIGFLFLRPYIQATYAELYGALRWNAAQKGICTADEIGAEYFV